MSSSTQKSRDDRVHDVFTVLLAFTSENDAHPISISQTMSHTLSCGNRVRINNVEVDVSSREVTVTVDFESCKPFFRRVTDIHAAASFIVDVMDRGKLCLECSTVYVGKHLCSVHAMAKIVGRKAVECCVCLSECVGATVFECTHVAHLACADRIEDGRCPICRRAISVLDEF